MTAHADIEILTFKEGLLSPMGHDLKLRIKPAELIVDAQAPSIRARFLADSLKVVCAMHDGREAPGELSEKNIRDIEHAMSKDVLRTQRYPDILFESTQITPREVVGRLTLHGVTRELRFPWHEEGGVRVAEVQLDQRTWGIEPFRAMMGALKLKPEVLVRVRLTA